MKQQRKQIVQLKLVQQCQAQKLIQLVPKIKLKHQRQLIVLQQLIQLVPKLKAKQQTSTEASSIITSGTVSSAKLEKIRRIRNNLK